MHLCHAGLAERSSPRVRPSALSEHEIQVPILEVPSVFVTVDAFPIAACTGGPRSEELLFNEPGRRWLTGLGH